MGAFRNQQVEIYRVCEKAIEYLNIVPELPSRVEQSIEEYRLELLKRSKLFCPPLFFLLTSGIWVEGYMFLVLAHLINMAKPLK